MSMAWHGQARPGEARPGAYGQSTKRGKTEMTDENKYYSFNSGAPTKPDVDAILKALPELRPGWRMNREELAAIVGEKYKSTRWRSIASALESRLRREKGLVLLYEKATQDYIIAKAGDTIKRTTDVFKSVTRKLGKQRRNLAATSNTANESERPIIEHQCRLTLALERETKKQNMNLVPSVKPNDNQIRKLPLE